MDGFSFEQRCAILRKFKENLLLQRERLACYLQLLEREEAVIDAGDAERLERYVEIEQGLMRELEAVDKVLAPLESMYRIAFPNGESEIPPLRAAIDRLCGDILARNARNRHLLKEKMQALRLEIDSLKRRRPLGRSSFASTPGLFDITV